MAERRKVIYVPTSGSSIRISGLKVSMEGYITDTLDSKLEAAVNQGWLTRKDYIEPKAPEVKEEKLPEKKLPMNTVIPASAPSKEMDSKEVLLKKLGEMDVSLLKEVASKNHIKLGNAKAKKTIINIIVKALTKNATV